MCLGDFTINKAFSSPFRTDIHPSMVVRYKKGDLYYKDYGDSDYKGNCFNCIMQKYKCNFQEALQIIDNYFNLQLTKNIVKIALFKKPLPIVKETLSPLIQFEYGKFSKEALNYWGKLKIGEQDLKNNNIYFPKKIYINRKKSNLSLLTFIYHYPNDTKKFNEGSVSIYKPFANKKEKWFKNVSFNYIEYLENIKGCDRAFLCSSKKETLFLKNLLNTNCIATLQAENLGCYSKEAEEVFKNVSEKYIVGNQDEPGKKFSWKMTELFQFKHINPKDKYLKMGCTDFADIAMKIENGEELVINHFNKKIFKNT